jgi:hypothetical protein
MDAFGREVASRTVAGVLAAIILAVLAAIWGWLRLVAPVLAKYVTVSTRELTAWGLVVILALAVVALTFVLAKQISKRASSLTLTVNSGVKPSVTMTHHGTATTYRVDGQILVFNDGTPNPWPTRFQCQIQKSGIEGGWDMLLRDGEWANVILGSVEHADISSSPQVMVVASLDHLCIRRGKVGQHVAVPDAGVVVELTFKAQPPLSQPIGPKRFRVVRNSQIATVDELA